MEQLKVIESIFIDRFLHDEWKYFYDTESTPDYTVYTRLGGPKFTLPNQDHFTEKQLREKYGTGFVHQLDMYLQKRYKKTIYNLD